jgi:hypothetical protein
MISLHAAPATLQLCFDGDSLFALFAEEDRLHGRIYGFAKVA